MTVNGDRALVNILVFSASLRADSYNSKLANLAARCLEHNGAQVDLAPMSDFDTPSFNADRQEEGEWPSGAIRFRDRLLECDAFVIASPEYNASMPGVLKNSVDWVSRYSPQPFNELHGLLLSASPSMVGGNRGLWALRIPLEHLGARVYPDMFSLAQAHKAFDDKERITDLQLQERFDNTLVGFLNLVEASKHYPCAKKVWVEYLGEQPDPTLDRIE